MDYYTWKEDFEKTVSVINDNKFIHKTSQGPCVHSKRDIIHLFYHQKDYVKRWLTDCTHKTDTDIISPKLTKEYIQKAIIKYMPLFDSNINVLEREEFKFYDDGYSWYIRKDYFPKSGNQITEKDVEYHITANNYRFITGKTGSKSFMCFIYIDKPDYLNYTCKTDYKTIKNTEYRILKKYF